MTSLDKAKETTLAKVIYSLGIANIGLANAKVICRHFDDDLEKIRHADKEEISVITKMIAPPMPAAVSTLLETPRKGQRPRNWLRTTLFTIAELTSMIKSSFIIHYPLFPLHMVLPQAAQLPPQSGLLGSMPRLAAPILNLFCNAESAARTKNAPGARIKIVIGS